MARTLEVSKKSCAHLQTQQASRSWSGLSRHAKGFGLVEVLVVVATLGILLTLGMVFLRPASARLFANDLKALLQTARYEAVRFQTPVAVVWNSSNQRFEMRLSENSNTLGAVCTTGTIRRSKGPAEYPGATVSGGVVNSGIVWLPSGLVQQCDGTALASALTVTVADGRTSFQVQLSTAGRVMIP